MRDIWNGWWIAAVAAGAWVLLVGAWLIGVASGAGDMLFGALAAVVPVGLIGLLAMAMRRIAETPQAAVAPPPQPAGLPRSEAEQMFRKLAQRQKATDEALAALMERREATPEASAETRPPARRQGAEPPGKGRLPKAEPGQPDLPLDGAPEPQAAPDWPDVLRALNFPQDADDRAGFDAMHRAMQDRQLALILRAAEDVLNLMSQDGVYMDDLDPRPIEPALWRRFAEGERGEAIAGLAAIEDADALAAVRGRMRSDEIMRDTGLHFLRHFDAWLKEQCAAQEDGELARLVETRSGRAFLLLGTVTGAFE
ncbi:hypothetical protein [Roseobacter sp. HKCCA0434]|uniref:hypothetical protein n=1 Tax=Roseobacter sp. HKCCA0434 TaxID=3079297 RepID=UPI002905D4AB|nr:hypothetical protein [Roseobacter sp. HKCCA0434]